MDKYLNWLINAGISEGNFKGFEIRTDKNGNINEIISNSPNTDSYPASMYQDIVNYMTGREILVRNE